MKFVKIILKNSLPTSQGTLQLQYMDQLFNAVYGNNHSLF